MLYDYKSDNLELYITNVIFFQIILIFITFHSLVDSTVLNKTIYEV